LAGRSVVLRVSRKQFAELLVDVERAAVQQQ
jgi:hypothetical protein